MDGIKLSLVELIYFNYDYNQRLQKRASPTSRTKRQRAVRDMVNRSKKAVATLYGFPGNHASHGKQL